MNILLIEPDRVLLATYTRAFELSGHTVMAATTGQEAVMLADESTPDIVVMEAQLPAHSGIEFLQEFVSYADWTNVPVVLNTYLSPVDMQPLAESLREDYNVHHICYKPKTTLKTLISVTQEILQKRGNK